MRIKFVAKKSNRSTSDWAKKSIQSVLNQSVVVLASKLEERLKEYKCEVHGGGSRGTVTVIPNLNKNTIEFKKSNFCCKEFSDKIDLKQ